jgi:hypothetical protein
MWRCSSISQARGKAAVEATREILVRLEAAPFIAQLDAALDGSLFPPTRRSAALRHFVREPLATTI